MPELRDNSIPFAIFIRLLKVDLPIRIKEKMKNRTFKSIKIDSDATMWMLKEEIVQQLAQNKIGRKLSHIELNRFSQGYTLWWGYKDVYKKLNDFIATGIKAVTDKKDNDWNDIDNSFLKELTLEEKTERLKEHSELKSRKQK